MADVQLENGYTRIANELLEALSYTDLSGSAWRCAIFIIRKTYGFKKKTDAISLSQYELGTGLTRMSVTRGITELTDKNIISKDKARYISVFSFNKDYETWGSIKPVTSNKNDTETSIKPVTKTSNKNDTHKRKKERKIVVAKKTMKKNRLGSYNETAHTDAYETAINLDGQEVEAEPIGKDCSADDVIALWNSYPTFAELAKKKNIKGKPRNPTTETVLLQPARKTRDLSFAFGVMVKRYGIDEFTLAIENYMRELIDRSPRDSWAGKRYSLFEFINPKRDIFKLYVNR